VGYTLATGGASGSVVALDPYWVLTAAHVVDVPESPPAALIMGGPNPDTSAEGIYIYVDQVVLHPDYVTGELRTGQQLKYRLRSRNVRSCISGMICDQEHVVYVPEVVNRLTQNHILRPM